MPTVAERRKKRSYTTTILADSNRIEVKPEYSLP
jgi:hypothetical protein